MNNLRIGNWFKRKLIPELFGEVFNEGNWNQGQVSLKADVCVFVTGDGAYSDECQQGPKRSGNFVWSSQSSTAPEGKKGREIIDGEKPVHIFYRKTKRERNCQFQYLGAFTYESHKGSKPMCIVFVPEGN
jgi:hypothetical protein